MMKDKILYVAILVTLPLLSFSQNEQFNRAYGNNGFDNGKGVVQDANDNYYIVGQTSSADTGDSDVLLFSIDQNGDERWSKHIGTQQTDIGNGIVLTDDDHLLIVGMTNGFGAGGYDVYLAKITLDGEFLWHKTFGGDDWDFAYDIISNGNDEYLLVGETYSFGEGNNDAYILKIDGDGNIIWEKTFGSTGQEAARSIKVDVSQEIVFIGEQKNTGDAVSRAWIVKIDQDGEEIWQYVHDEDTLEDEIGRDLFFDNDAIIAMSNVPDAADEDVKTYTWKLTSDLTTEWTNEYDDLCFYTLLKKSDNFYAVIGTTGSNAFMFWRAVSDGGFLSLGNTTYDVNLEYDVFYDAINTSDDGFICVGETDIGDGQISAFVAKFDTSLTTIDGTELIDIALGLYDFNIDPLLEIYPNPTIDNLYITASEQHAQAQVFIFNLAGKLVHQSTLQNNAIDVKSLNAGMYQILAIKDDQIILSEKFLRE